MKFFNSCRLKKKIDISNLQSELRQSSKVVSTEVKKIKEGADYPGRNRVIKFSFCSNQRLKKL